MADQKDIVEIILDDTEKAAVQSFLKNPVALRAVKKILLASCYHNGTLRAGMDADPLRNAALSLSMNAKGITNEQLGADIRALTEGVRIVELGFQKLETLNVVKVEPKSTGNKAR